MKTTKGKLKEMLVLDGEDKRNGKPAIIVYPKGTIVEILNKEDPSQGAISSKNIKDAAKYLVDCDE